MSLFDEPQQQHDVEPDPGDDEPDRAGLHRTTVEAGLASLARTFGPNHRRVAHVRRRVEQFSQETGDQFAAAYVKWAVRFPDAIGEDGPAAACFCSGGMGWVSIYDDDGVELVRPCTRCNKSAHDHLRRRAGHPVEEGSDGVVE